MATQPAEGSQPSATIPSGHLQVARQRLDYYLRLFGLQGKGLALLGGLLATAWVMSGIYKVQPDEQGVVVRFGKWVDTTEPGLHYHLPWPVETLLLPKVTQINQIQLANLYDGAPSDSSDPREKQMLTGDENLVEAIYDRMKSARQQEAKQLRAQGAEWAQQIQAKADSERTVILSEAQRQSAIIRGEADAEANLILAHAFSKDPKFYKFYRSLQTYRQALADSAATLVLSPDSALLHDFKSGPAGAKP